MGRRTGGVREQHAVVKELLGQRDIKVGGLRHSCNDLIQVAVCLFPWLGFLC